MSALTLHVGGAHDMGRRFAAAFDLVATGEDFEERHVTSLSLETMMAVLRPSDLSCCGNCTAIARTV